MSERPIYNIQVGPAYVPTKTRLNEKKFREEFARTLINFCGDFHVTTVGRVVKGRVPGLICYPVEMGIDYFGRPASLYFYRDPDKRGIPAIDYFEKRHGNLFLRNERQAAQIPMNR